MLRLAFLLLSISLFVNRSFGQGSDPLITLDFHDVSLEVILRTIQEQSKLPFSYSSKRIPIDKKINLTVKDKKLSAVLDQLSTLAGLRFTRVENQIIVQPEKPSPESRATKTLITYSGYVKDAATGEALIGSTLSFPALQTGVACNAFGFFSISVPAGTYEVVFSFVGYRSKKQTLALAQSAFEEVRLDEEPPMLQEIVVSEVINDPVRELETSKAQLPPARVREKPALLGEMDVIKSLEAVPGVRLHSDGSTFYYVRGGNRDQNLVLIDDAPVYNPSHLLGFFSSIIPDAVSDIQMYRGEMPASLGGRLSSVLDVRTRKGNDQHTQVWGGASLISNKLGIEGPITVGKSSYLLSGRFSRLKWLANAVNANITQFQFHDLTGKVNFKAGSKDRVYFSFYSGKDGYFGGNSGLTWGNSAGTLRWNHVWTDKLFMNSTLSGAGYDYQLFTDVAKQARWNSHISNFNLKSDFSYFAKPESEITFGLGISGYFMNPGNFQSPIPSSVPALSVRNSAEVATYVNHEWQLNDRWGLNYGLRLTSWNNTGDAFEYRFNSDHEVIDTLTFAKGQTYKSFENVEPRFTASYRLSEVGSIKFGYARNVQNLHLITNSVSPFTSLEVWLPSSFNIKPQIANQVSIGYYLTLPKPGLSLMVEAFHKNLSNQIEFASHAATFLNPAVEGELRFGKGWAYGTELQLKKDAGRLRGWIGYSYARSKRKFAEINEGRTYNAFSDRPHQINIVLSYDVSLRCTVGANWNYLTGSPYSAPVGYYSFNGQEVPLYDQKNNSRLPAYHRLDLAATWKLNRNLESKYQHSLSLSVFNFYARKNPNFINFNKVQTGDHSFKVPINLLDNNQEVSQFYLFSFTPSVTYNFKWR